MFVLCSFRPGKRPPGPLRRCYRETPKPKEHPDVKAKLARSGGEPMDMTPAEFQAYIRQSVDMNHALAKAAGIKPQ